MGSVEFRIAGAEDDPDLRRLLRDNPMAGAISVSLEREPDAFLAGSVEGERYQMIVARDRLTRRTIGMASRSVYPGYFNGEPCRLGYLGQLRLDRAYRGRAGILPAGFALISSLRSADDLPFDLTSIVADNTIARRVLGAGLPALPAYRELEPFVTSIVPAGTRRRALQGPAAVSAAVGDDIPAIAGCLRRNRARYQFAPSWTADDLRSADRSRGLAPEDFFVACRGRQVIGCLALWDQQPFKQIVVRGYARRLRWQRAGLNALARLAGTPRLPTPGQPLPHLYLSHVAIDDDCPETFAALFDAACDRARARGASCVMAGFAERHPFVNVIARDRRRWTYRSLLYTVHWPGAGSATLPDGRMPHLEVALL